MPTILCQTWHWQRLCEAKNHLAGLIFYTTAFGFRQHPARKDEKSILLPCSIGSSLALHLLPAKRAASTKRTFLVAKKNSQSPDVISHKPQHSGSLRYALLPCSQRATCRPSALSAHARRIRQTISYPQLQPSAPALSLARTLRT
jgi:hypothetical protein